MYIYIYIYICRDGPLQLVAQMVQPGFGSPVPQAMGHHGPQLQLQRLRGCGPHAPAVLVPRVSQASGRQRLRALPHFFTGEHLFCKGCGQFRSFPVVGNFVALPLSVPCESKHLADDCFRQVPPEQSHGGFLDHRSFHDRTLINEFRRSLDELVT